MARIKILGTSHPFRGGIAAFNERLAVEYQSQGHTIDIETFKLQYPDFLFPGKTQYADWSAPADLKIKRTIISISPINWIRTGLRIKKEKPDIVIFKFWLPFMGPCFGTIARIIKRNRHTKIVAVLDNIIPHEKRPGDFLLTRYFVKSMDGFIAMSKSVLHDLLTFDKTKPKLFSPHPVFDNFGDKISRSQALKNLDFSDGFNYLLFFGLVREYKGLDLLIEAIADDRLKNRNLKVIVAGEFYTDSKKYLDMIVKYDLTETFIIHPEFIPDSEVNNWFCACDMVVQPYKSATQSGVTQIGYHFEKPMLVTDVGGLPEIISHQKSGYVVPTNPKDIAEAIIDFYDNSREASLIKGVVEEKERFSWNRMVKNISLLFDEENQ